ncbi:ABC transporter permease [Ignatzschineria sp. RMDPL8A]|uniref:ABC transporter permease n=1 Tax=Ignatzschineria sp. RMDPL8A TaxID=2999236 RepID=UPI0016AEFC24|nr:ABC transporter permease [Ignatzschineria sp. RMDPL8A]MDG9729663.1 ABC transporter permease [Ignatzschineria sp. RMDPL8A]NLD08546.1 ABC transporter permease [Xanthomonadaceae bacterium]
MTKKMTVMNWIALIGGLLFLYIPIFLVIVYSFNESKLVTVWGGFSTKWYPDLFKQAGIWEAAKTSLLLGFFSSTFAVILGTMAAFALVKFRRFRGKTLFSGIAYAPMVMPEIIMGSSLGLTFVALNINTGFLTMMIAHITFTMCYVIVVVQSRLTGFDRHIEEAAMDLGADGVRTFFYITLPMILPGVLAAWLLSFTLSLDDLIIATFTTGPGATTLPIWIYSKARLGVSPNINALSTIMIGIIATGVFLVTMINHRIEKNRYLDRRNAEKE